MGSTSWGKISNDDWWQNYTADLSASYYKYIEDEQSASAIFEFQSVIMPGLLQTERYAQVVYGRKNWPTYMPTLDVGPKVRMQRQWHLFERPAPFEFHCIILESVLQLKLGGPSIYYEQLAHLLDVAKQPNVTLQVVTWDKVAELAWHYEAGNFTLLSYSDPEKNSLLYREDPIKQMVRETSEFVIAYYQKAFHQISAIAKSPEETADYINAILKVPTR